MKNALVLTLFFQLILEVGVEYRIEAKSEGWADYCLVKEDKGDGVYIVYTPSRWLGLRGHGMTARPAYEYRKDPRWERTLHAADLIEAIPLTPKDSKK